MGIVHAAFSRVLEAESLAQNSHTGIQNTTCRQADAIRVR